MSRRRGRELAMQLLFQLDQSPVPPDEARQLFWRIRRTAPEAREFAERLVDGYLSRRDEVDEAIRRTVRRWRLERLAAVDRNILRAAVVEHWTVGTPKAVVIDEAVEIARKYGGEKSPEFVNGVLDHLLHDEEAEPAAESAQEERRKTKE
ncbi:MAG: transcription antitermination factor NusB [Acidobacteriota bacterium]